MEWCKISNQECYINKEFMTIDVEAWYERYGPMVTRRCRALLRNNEEAMDAVQDVFVNLLRAESRLRGAFPSSLLYTMATNVCLNRLRGRKREAPQDLAGAGEELPFISGDYGQVDAEMLVQAILEDESVENRAICFMYHADGMSLREIGEAVGLSVSGVRKRITAFGKRARLRLGEDY